MDEKVFKPKSIIKARFIFYILNFLTRIVYTEKQILSKFFTNSIKVLLRLYNHKLTYKISIVNFTIITLKL